MTIPKEIGTLSPSDSFCYYRDELSWQVYPVYPLALDARIHIGSEQAGPRVAAIISVVETCRRLKIPIRDYLSSILPGLANFPINRVAKLTPASWLARH
jgi:hypothetical protein